MDYNKKTIRLPGALRTLMEVTAEHTRLSLSEVVRACIRYGRKNVIQKQNLKLYDTKKESRICVYLNELEFGVRELSQILAAIEYHCNETLKKPKREPFIPPAIPYEHITINEDE